MEVVDRRTDQQKYSFKTRKTHLHLLTHSYNKSLSPSLSPSQKVLGPLEYQGAGGVASGVKISRYLQ